MAIRPQKKAERTRDRSIYVKQNKKYQGLLAVLIISFVLVFAAVIQRSGVTAAPMWRHNVLVQLIVGAREAARNR